MRQAVLTFDDDTIAEWGFAPFRDAGIRDGEILSCEGSRGVVRLHLEERPDEQRLDDTDVIQWWERVSREDSEHVYLVEADGADAPDRNGADPDQLPRTEHMQIEDEGFTLTYMGRQDRISDMVAGFEAAGVDATLQQLRDYRVQNAPIDTLTDRQQEVLEVAFENGYFEVPRKSSTADLAEELELDSSTVSEHLQRAQRNLIATVLNRSP